MARDTATLVCAVPAMFRSAIGGGFGGKRRIRLPELWTPLRDQVLKGGLRISAEPAAFAFSTHCGGKGGRRAAEDEPALCFSVGLLFQPHLNRNTAC